MPTILFYLQGMFLVQVIHCLIQSRCLNCLVFNCPRARCPDYPRQISQTTVNVKETMCSLSRAHQSSGDGGEERSEIARRHVFFSLYFFYVPRIILWENVPGPLLPCRFATSVASASISKWQGLFVAVLICLEETRTDSWRRQEEGATTSPPPPSLPSPRRKMSSLPWLGCRGILMKRVDI